LQSIESPFEIEDYIKAYLGDTKSSNDFLKNYLNYRSNYRKIKNPKPQADDLCAPAKAINPAPTSSSESSVNNDAMHKSAGKTNTLKDYAKKSKKGRKIDISILGFKGAADPIKLLASLMF
jgi:PERQ amino acid-rich with GYF domain-containing protein